MKLRIAFINPAFPLSLWDFSLCRDIDGYAFPHAPLALPTLAALTPAPHAVQLFDENVAPIDLGLEVDVVGLTGYWVQRQRVFELADHFRARGIRVCIGGPLVESSTIDEVASHADHVFMGEAEYTWPRFLNDLSRNEATPRYVQSTLIDMADSPVPRFDLLPRGAYSAATIETSRGCPYSCEFCEIPARLGQKSRTKTVAQVMAEVRLQYQLGARTVFFIDDHFLGRKSRADELLDALGAFVRETEGRIFFSCQFTINLAKDEALLEKLAAANFRRVFVGLETPRRDSLALAKKKQNLTMDPVEAVRRLHAYNIIVWAGLIVGFDTDDDAIFDDQLAFLEASGVPVAMIGRLQAIPGTALHARLAAAGRLRNETTVRGVRGTWSSLSTSNIEPTGALDEDRLARGYRRLVRAAYEPEAYGRRVIKALLDGHRPVIRAKTRPRASDLAILGRLARWYLWTSDHRRRRLFLDVTSTILRKRPEQLATALMHLVVWKHLHTFYNHVADAPFEAEPPKATVLLKQAAT
jgi:radical SAM superfamily enzyme YgiQ (UPF0313 family)